MSKPIVYNPDEGRFEQAYGDLIAYANVRRKDDIIYIDYVEAPLPLRGKGAAGAFMHGLMKQLREDSLKVVPICGYAASWLKRHSEYHDLVKVM